MRPKRVNRFSDDFMLYLFELDRGQAAGLGQSSRIAI